MVQRKSFTQSIPLPGDTTYTVDVTNASGYTPGRPNVSQGVIESDITIQATPANPTTLTISSTIYECQYIKLSVYNSDGTAVTKTYTNPTSLSLAYNTKFSVALIANDGYIKSTLVNIVEDYIYSLTRNINISAESEATPIMCEIFVEPQEHQTVTVTTNKGVTIESDRDYEVSSVVPYWTRYYINVTADPGYIAGEHATSEQTVYKSNPTFTPYPEDPTGESGYVTASALAATENKHRLTIYKYAHQTITAYVTFEDNTEEYNWDTDNPIESTSSYKVFEIFDSSIMTVRIDPADGYQSIYPVMRYVEGGTVYTVDITDSDTEYTIDKDIELQSYNNQDASISYHTITLNQSRDEIMYLTCDPYYDITGTVTLKHFSTFTIRAESLYPDLYNPGEVISTAEPLTKVSGSSTEYTGTVTGDNTIYITPVTLV